jgi:hypothetical protein
LELVIEIGYSAIKVAKVNSKKYYNENYRTKIQFSFWRKCNRLYKYERYLCKKILQPEKYNRAGRRKS